ncbi:hypothetical protein Tco_1465503 [Tanacetum coccineum]
MFESRRTTIPFLSRLNDYYCDEKKGSYGPQFLEDNSYGASHIDNFIPRKEKDPGSFTLPCYINNVCFDNALADLRASVSVMPLSTYLNLGLGELAHIKLTVELADRTVKYQKGNFLEDMDAYRDKGMGEVIFSKPFLREVGINARRFKGMITIYNGNEEVTYQMVRSHPRFKRHTNEQCNKISPLLKVSEEDKMNGILHSYQKLKSFYEGVLNLGPEYVRDAKMEEWLTHEHISVHEIDLAKKKSTMLVKYLQPGNLKVLES